MVIGLKFCHTIALNLRSVRHASVEKNTATNVTFRWANSSAGGILKFCQ